MAEYNVPRSALVIVAHPDDAEFTMAGTVATWSSAGCAVHYCLCTDGNAGSHEPGMTRERLAEIRRREQRAACDRLGVASVTFLGHDDGQLVADLALRRELVEIIRAIRPEAVIAQDPTRLFISEGYINHPDHRAAGQAALDAVAPACEMPLLWPELGAPHRVRWVYVWGHAQPNVWVDTSLAMETKVAALREHVSQLGDHDPGPMMREWGQQSAAMAGEGFEGRYAEAFLRVTINQEAS